jgi:glycosyltransferase involved in cell wall biosynthesis
MKSVLMIAYGFPPEGNAGVYRSLRFVRHLPSRGWQPTVITLETDFFERYDPSLLSQVPKEIEVIRVRNRDPWQTFLAKRNQRMYTQFSEASAAQVARILSSHQNPIRSRARELVRSIEAWIYHPDIAMGWIAPAVKAAQQFCNRNSPDVIWATAGPVSSFHVAAQASRRTGVPYVLDFRDAWTIIPTEFDTRRTNWARRLGHRTMFRLLKGARAVIFRYDTEAECFWRAYQAALDTARIHLIPNGYEGAIDKFTPSDGNKCNILYTGTLSDYRYDTLLQALCSLKKSSPDLIKQLHIHFNGEGTEVLANKSAVLGLADVITTSGPISNKDVIRLSRESHALLVLGRPFTMRGYELFAPAKLFGYLKAGRPIIGILPHDEANKILRHIGVSTVADVNSVIEIVALFQKLLLAWNQGKLSSLIPNPKACHIYSGEYQTQALIRALEAAPASDPFVPGLVEIPPSLREEIKERERKEPIGSKKRRRRSTPSNLRDSLRRESADKYLV